ncbi:MAG TPA: DUF1427 family protein [Pseudomonadales bacterium]|nr:DUF1427 family protein [Pseudomonadales bacterium]
MRVAVGFVLAFAIGVLCRVAHVPLPAPPVLIGALLVVAMSAGYAVTDRYATRRANANRDLCGGPSGAASSERPPR